MAAKVRGMERSMLVEVREGYNGSCVYERNKKEKEKNKKRRAI